MRRWLACAVVAAAWLVSSEARSDGEPTAKEAEVPASPESLRQGDPHSVFQAGVSLLALPGAEVCPTSPQECEPGETSIAFSLHSLGRIHDFGFGAGITWGFGLRPDDAAPGDPDGTLGRGHSRSYFLYEGVFRYYLPRLRAWEWWVGASVGGVVVNDSWTVLADREPYADTAFVGPRAQTLATEGFALGSAVGGHWRFAEEWVFGTHFRYANWFLPGDREATPVGDLASLAGRIDVFDVGLALGWRLSI